MSSCCFRDFNIVPWYGACALYKQRQKSEIESAMKKKNHHMSQALGHTGQLKAQSNHGLQAFPVSSVKIIFHIHWDREVYLFIPRYMYLLAYW